MRKIMCALALMSATPAIAQDQPVNAEKMVTVAKNVCPDFYIAVATNQNSELTINALLKAAQEAGMNESEQIWLMSLCTVYGQGLVDGIKVAKSH